MTEAAIQAGLMSAVTWLGGRVFHTKYAVGSVRGFPDLTVAMPDGRKLWLEIKGPRGRLSDEQVAWIEMLNATETVALVVWPDWDRVNTGLAHWPSVPQTTYEAALDLLQTGGDR